MTDRIPVRYLPDEEAQPSLGEYRPTDTVPVAFGGTGATTPEDARLNLGIVDAPGSVTEYPYTMELPSTATPTTGNVSRDTADPTTTAVLYIHKLDGDGVDQTGFLNSLKAGDWVNLFQVADPAIEEQYDATGPAVANGSVYEIPVSPYANAGALVNGDACRAYWRISESGGDMLATVYDPQTIEGDAFARANHTGTQSLATISDAGTAAAADTGDFDAAGTAAAGDSAHLSAFAHGDIPTADQKAGLDNAPTAITAANPAASVADLGAVGGGDMLAATYDPQTIAADAFARANHTGTQTLATISDAGTAAASDSGDFDAAGTAAAGDSAHLSAFNHANLLTNDERAGFDAGTAINAVNPPASIDDAQNIADAAVEKASVFTSVKAFGATGDGVTDDTSAIQACLDSIDSGIGISFPPGTYILSDRIRPHAGQRLFGYGATLKATTNIPIYDDTVGAYNNWVIWPQTNPVPHGVEIRGITVDLSAGGNTAKYHAIGGAFSFAEYIVVQDCIIIGGGVGYGGIFFSGVVGPQIRDNFVADLFGEQGFGIKAAYSKSVVISGNRMEFIGVKRSPSDSLLPNSADVGDWRNVGALWLYGNAGVECTNNYIYATGGSALKIDSSSTNEGSDTICTNNHIVGSGAGGISLQLKLNTHDWLTKCICTNNQIIGWECGAEAVGHDGLYVGGENTTTGERPENIVIADNLVTCFAPWEIPSFVGGLLVIDGSYNIYKDQAQASGTYFVGSCFSLNYASHFTLSNNIALYAAGKAYSLLYCNGGIVNGNTSRFCGWGAVRGLAQGVYISGSAAISVSNNVVLDHAPGVGANLTNCPYYRFDNSVRTLFTDNTATRIDTINCNLQYAGIALDNNSIFTLFGLSEEYSIDIGGFQISGLDQLNMLLRTGSGTYICRQSGGGSIVLTMGASQQIYPWFKTVRKANTGTYTATLYPASDSGTAEIVFINDSGSNDITLAVQSGDSLNGALDGSIAIVPNSMLIAVCNGANGWRTILAADLPTAGSSFPSRSTVSVSAGAATFDLNGSAYTCQLSEDLTAISVPLPAGGDASAFEYGARVDFTAPGAGGPFAVSIPTAWLQLGPLDAISLSAGDEAVVLILSTYSDGTIGYTAQQGVPGA